MEEEAQLQREIDDELCDMFEEHTRKSHECQITRTTDEQVGM